MYYGYYLDGDNKVFICATTPLRDCVELTEEEYYQALEEQMKVLVKDNHLVVMEE